MKNNIRNSYVRRLTVLAMFCALAFVLTYVKLPVVFLSLEIKDSAIVLATLLVGPLGGLSIAVLVPFLELITHSTTGVYGLIMNILSSVTFSMVTGLIYKYKKSFYGAIVGLISGVCSVAAVMVLANLLVTPYYMGVPVSEVAKLIPKLLLPFNLVKASLNAGVVLLLYKPLSNVLKRVRLLPRGEAESNAAKKNGRSLAVTLIALAIIGASLAIVLFVLK